MNKALVFSGCRLIATKSSPTASEFRPSHSATDTASAAWANGFATRFAASCNVSALSVATGDRLQIWIN
jgi:hypothetical protein